MIFIYTVNSSPGQVYLTSITLYSYKNFFLVKTFKIYSLSNFQVCNTVLLPIVPVMYMMSSWHLFYTRKFILFDFLHPFLPPLNPCLWQPPICICELGVVCVLDFAYKWDHMVFSLLWLNSLSIVPLRSIQAFVSGKISFFLWQNNIPLFICTISSLPTDT